MNVIDKVKSDDQKALGSLEKRSPEIAGAFPALGRVGTRPTANADPTVQETPDSTVPLAVPQSKIKKRNSAAAAVKRVGTKNSSGSESAKPPRGVGRVYRPSWRDKKSGEIKQSPNWWIAYSVRGTLKREPAHTSKEAVASKLLRKRLGEIALGKPVGPDIERTTFEDLAAMVVSDYKANGRKSLARVQDALAHLREYFGDFRAVEITGDKVTAYIAYRLEQKTANSTINCELAALSRAFNLGIRSNRVSTRPYIGKLALNNTRKGFFEWEQFSRVLKNLSEDLQPAIETAYITGWRIHDEIFTRQRHHADLKGRGWLRLDPGETKNGEGRNFPFTVRLREIISYQLERTKALEKATGRIIPWLFHRDGRPIKSFRRSWLTACVKAGLGTEIRSADGKLIKKIGNRIPHDFRRTAVRNLERAGVSRSDAMKMVGHKTESIYRRYAIADEKSMKESAGKLDQFYAIDQQPTETTK
jgi:Phage integrase family